MAFKPNIICRDCPELCKQSVYAKVQECPYVHNGQKSGGKRRKDGSEGLLIVQPLPRK